MIHVLCSKCNVIAQITQKGHENFHLSMISRNGWTKSCQRCLRYRLSLIQLISLRQYRVHKSFVFMNCFIEKLFIIFHIIPISQADIVKQKQCCTVTVQVPPFGKCMQCPDACKKGTELVSYWCNTIHGIWFLSGMISSKVRFSHKILCQLLIYYLLGYPGSEKLRIKYVLGMILLFWDIPEILICSAGTLIVH